MSAVIRHDWKREELLALFDLPFPELLFRAASMHREHFDPAQVQVSTLLSVLSALCRRKSWRCLRPPLPSFPSYLLPTSLHWPRGTSRAMKTLPVCSQPA